LKLKKVNQDLNEKQIDLSEIVLNEEQQKLFERLENSKNHIFITGKAGTGKSTLLQYFKQNSNKELVVVAPTGVAALNVGGQTIHSLFKFPLGFIARNSLKSIDDKTKILLKNVETVVIDEISMVRADLMDAIDHRLRQSKGNDLAFGGVQIVMFGDMYQLTPIVDSELAKYFAENMEGFYFFNASVWRDGGLQIYELKEIIRQRDETFKSILNLIREGNVNERDLSELNKRAYLDIPTDGVIMLATRNRTVSEINQGRLDNLNGKVFSYRAVVSGELKEGEFPTEEILNLKKGAQIMLLRNDRLKRWVNGTLGYIEELSEDEIKVNIDGNIYSLPLESWEKVKYFYDATSRKVKE